MIFPTHQQPALPLHPPEEPLDNPSSLRPPKPTTVLRPRPRSIAPVRRDHLDASLPQGCVQRSLSYALSPIKFAGVSSVNAKSSDDWTSVAS